MIPIMSGTWRDFTDEEVIHRNIVDLQNTLTGWRKRPQYSARFFSEEDLPIIESRLESIVNASLVIHCTNPRTLLVVKEEGRFKSVFEMPRKLAEADPFYIAKRERVEEVLFGSRQGSLGIIYAALYPQDSRSTFDYGKIRVILREEVRERTTLTRLDSLNFFWEETVAKEYQEKMVWSDPKTWKTAPIDIRAALVAGVPFSYPKAILVPHKTEIAPQNWESLYDIVGSEYYFEAQVHGGVSIEDIAEVQERSRTKNLSDTILDKEVLTWLESKQIPFRMI
jgi:hypothetical protein